jgi:hypothetical protein
MTKNSWNALASYMAVLISGVGVGITHGTNGALVMLLAASFVWMWRACDY